MTSAADTTRQPPPLEPKPPRKRLSPNAVENLILIGVFSFFALLVGTFGYLGWSNDIELAAKRKAQWAEYEAAVKAERQQWLTECQSLHDRFECEALEATRRK